MGLGESSLTVSTKPFSCLSHCKVSCDSPCCASLRGDTSRCELDNDTHGHISSDRDKEGTGQ